VLALTASGFAQDRRAPWRVSWFPEDPVQGSLVSISLLPDSPAIARQAAATLSGVAAGEAVHFEALTGAAAYWALAAIPLDALDSLVMRVMIEGAGASETLTIWVPIVSRADSSEPLHPPPKFTRPPDPSIVVRGTREHAVLYAARRRSHDTPRLWHEAFVRPVAGRVTSPFGVWRERDGVRQDRHDGVDLAGAAGTSVRAANRGVVAVVADQYYGGWTVLMDHGAGLSTSYQHLGQALVAVGDTVARAQLIGRAGATGKATGPHLHWGASYGALVVDPLTLLAVPPPF
jgi:hypothetical protein